MKQYFEMDFRELGTKFAKELNKHETRKTYDEEFAELWQCCKRFGLFKLTKENSKNERNTLSDIIDLMYGIGYGSENVGITFSANVHIWACIEPIKRFASEEMKRNVLPDLYDGIKIGGHAISENAAGSDVFNLETTYEETVDGYIINGVKNYVTNAPYADIYLVYARKKDTKGFKSISCFLVEKNNSGFSVGEKIEKMGMKYTPMASLYLNDCKIKKNALLGREGQGMSIFNYTMAKERPLLLAFQVGIMDAQLQKNIQFCKMRKQGGKSIFEYQSVQNRIADMAVRLEASKLFLKEITEQMSNNKNTYAISSIAKLYISESLVNNCLSSMKNMGTLGYLAEYAAEQQLRDSLGSLFYSGTSDIQRNIIANMI